MKESDDGVSLESMRKDIVEDILDNGAHDEIRRAVEAYVDGYADESVREMYRKIHR
jgi:hypothetical protein